MYPTTEWGRLVGSVVIVCGLVIIALPITILGTNYTDEYARYRANLRLGGDGVSMNLRELQLLDRVAWLRFASVYKGFDAAADFQRELVLLKKLQQS